eukprot:gene2107-4117_t
MTIWTLLFKITTSVAMTTFIVSIEDNVLRKDLYKTLQIQKSANVDEIKKAYRKMARKYHPDKNPNDEKAAPYFVEIAEAYEILSNTDQQQEYNRRREEAIKLSGASKKHQASPSRDYNENMHGERPMFTPSFTYDVIPTGEIILPYYPIMISPERTFFALLDKTCAFKVYEGSYDELLQFEYTQSIELLDENFSLLYKTPERSSLNGKCFAAVDEIGLLHIYNGHPSQKSHTTEDIWISTLKYSYEEPMDVYYRRYSLSLSYNGELAISYTTSGNSDLLCVWSTTSCSTEIAMIKLQQMKIFRRFENIRRCFKNNFSVIDMFYYFHMARKKTHTKMRRFRKIWNKFTNRMEIPEFRAIFLNGLQKMDLQDLFGIVNGKEVKKQRNPQRNRRGRQYR